MSQPTPRLSRRLLAWLLPLTVTVIVATLTALAWPARTLDPDDPLGPTSFSEPLDFLIRDLNNPLALGSVDAPVRIFVHSDYQCDLCAVWSHTTLPEIVNTYVNSGKVRLVWQSNALVGSDSERATRAAYAAGLQGRFSDYHAGLFPNGSKRTTDQLTDDALFALAREIGLNEPQFHSDFYSVKTAQALLQNVNESRMFDITSIPAIIINGEHLEQTLSTEETFSLIEDNLRVPQ
ncbi:thioredoxin domain-containing protein [Lysinibacter sp. HNR]|uniref:DsbA family protein n=1 Tax=Lysinibacter sp. HNR TaxID=3031408 RepID=UPI002435FCFA|nr:thioredoxin domain-containing protein [Lysinibacter sp. HNR]WGD37140.1 thioredoxin domain-containing protein [Lysinibacter sp. HNR]